MLNKTCSKQEELVVTITSIFFHNPKNEWGAFSGRVVGSNGHFSKKNNSIRFSGQVLSPKEGCLYILKGHFEPNKKYGPQFVLDEPGVPKPNNADDFSEDEIFAFLCSKQVKGIGEATAKRLIDKFGADTLKVIQSENDYVKLAKVRGISRTKAKEIHEQYISAGIIQEALKSLAVYNISGVVASKIIDKWGLKGIDYVKNNPYVLADPLDGIKGIGFTKADEYARNMGIARDDSRRIKSLIYYYSLCGEKTGNIFFTYGEFLNIAKKEIDGIPGSLIKSNIDELVDAGKIVLEDGRIYARAIYEKEKESAKLLVNINQGILSPCICEIETVEQAVSLDLGRTVKYGDGQRLAIEMASLDTTGVMVLTGGPGTGKTTVTRGIIAMFELSGLRVLCAAPTGRAAKRMKEATGHNAKTIHSLLEYKGGYFQKDARHKLDAEAIIIDEASMIDSNLFYSLLLAIEPGTRLVFVGDVDQLPSVGAGNVLRDIIDTKFFAVTHLTKVYRQAEESLIVRNANSINRGQMIRLNNTENTDCVFLNIDNEEQQTIADKVVTLVTETIPAEKGFSLKDIQILIPMKKGILGVDNINRLMQEKLSLSHNARYSRFTESKFCIGDRVMQMKNNVKENVFNGDIGYVVSIDNTEQTLTVEYPPIPGETEPLRVSYNDSTSADLKLAYASTIHKSQGSEYKCVVMLLCNQYYIMLQRNLAYTALTRAKNMAYILGTPSALVRSVQNNPAVKRNTTLKERIIEYIKICVAEQELDEGSILDTPSDTEEEFPFE